MSARIRVIVLALAVLCAACALVGCAAQDSDESSGELHAAVPDLEGMSVAEAETTLAEAGYTLGDISEAPAEGVEPGTVISQSPIRGTSLSRDSAVDIVVATEE